MKVVLFRHFVSEGNKNSEAYHQHNADVPLADEAGEQAPDSAEALDKLLEKYELSPNEVKIISSPAKRTRQSFGLLQEHSNHPAMAQQTPQYVEWLREMHPGKARDLDKYELEALYPNHQAEWRRLLKDNPAQIKAPYGETPLSRYEAVKEADFPEQLKAWKAQGVKMVICISHKTSISAMREVLCEGDPNDIIRGKRLSNGGILEMTVDEQGRFSQPELIHGKYEALDPEKIVAIAARKVEPAESVSIKKVVRHEALKQVHPEGLLAEEAKYCAPELLSNQLGGLLQQEVSRLKAAKKPLLGQ